MSITTSDLYDAHSADVTVCDVQFRSFGRIESFAGQCSTVKIYEGFRTIREALEQAWRRKNSRCRRRRIIALCAGRRPNGRVGNPQWLGRCHYLRGRPGLPSSCFIKVRGESTRDDGTACITRGEWPARYPHHNRRRNVPSWRLGIRRCGCGAGRSAAASRA